MTSDNPAVRQKVLGVSAAVVATLIWSSWTVVSKMGVSSELGAQDLAAIRFGVSGLLSVPIVLYFKPFRTLSAWQVVALAATGGIPYVLLLYFGFEFAPASHAGVLVNGLVPAVTIAYRSIATSSRPRASEAAGVLAILAGVTLVVAGTSGSAGNHLVGDSMFLAAAFLFGGFLSFSGKWKIGPAQILFALSLTGAVIYLPIWWLVLPKTLGSANPRAILLQALYQGLLAPMVGMLLIGLATARCGPVMVASILSTVPTLSAVMAALWLGESISPINWVGIGVATVGILFTVLGTKKRITMQTLAGSVARS
jgi:drug/metabolite transporter (DMT)-like permease